MLEAGRRLRGLAAWANHQHTLFRRRVAAVRAGVFVEGIVSGEVDALRRGL